MMTAVARDFRVETYSVVSLTEISFAVSTFTGMPGGPCACAPRAEPLPQAQPSATNTKVAARPARRHDWADGQRFLSVGKSMLQYSLLEASLASGLECPAQAAVELYTGRQDNTDVTWESQTRKFREG